MYTKKIKVEKEVEHLEGGDCIKVHWSSLKVDKCILGYNLDVDKITATSLKDGTYFTIPRKEHGVTIKQISKASGGMLIEYIGKLKSTEHSSEKYVFVKEE